MEGFQRGVMELGTDRNNIPIVVMGTCVKRDELTGFHYKQSGVSINPFKGQRFSTLAGLACTSP